MPNDQNLKKLELKLFLSMYEDGFWEIWFGLFLLGNAVGALLADNDFIRILNTFLVMLLIPLLVLLLGKRFITLPRIGLVRFSSERKAKHVKLALIIFALNIPVFLLWILSGAYELPEGFRNWLNTYYGSPVVFAAMILIVFASGALITGVKRMYAYGIIFAASVFFSELSYVGNGSTLEHFLPFAIAGDIFLIIGLYLLVRFMRKYRLPVPGDTDGIG